MLLNISLAHSATTLFSGTCYKATASGAKYYVATHGSAGSSATAFSWANLPNAQSMDPNCTAGTYYRILPYGSYNSSGTDLEGAVGVVFSCTACADDYTLTLKSAPFTYGSFNYQITCTTVTNLEAYQCKYSGTSGGGTTTGCNSSNCASDTTWQPYVDSDATQYVYKKIRSCASDGVTCNETTQYACYKGYYGNAGSTTKTGCVACPLYFVNGATYPTTTVDHAAPSINACYVKATGNVTKFNDASGTFVFTPYTQATDYCYYDLGNCSTYKPACSAVTGTTMTVVSGTKTHLIAGDAKNCWCNANGKSFLVTSFSRSSQCIESCPSACQNAFVGHAANGYQPLISLDDLGC